MDSSMFGYFFWGFLIVYAIVMLIVSPKKVSVGGFFRGEDKLGRAVSPGMLTASIFVSWIQAKSVMNCTNLGAEYGIVGGIACVLARPSRRRYRDVPAARKIWSEGHYQLPSIQLRQGSLYRLFCRHTHQAL